MKNLIGQKFGNLEVLKEAPPIYFKCGVIGTKFLCLCDCGEEKAILRASLIGGHTQSCGCLQRRATSKANSTHKLSGSKLYNTWVHIKGRCLNKKDKSYKNYGGRGVNICKRWLNFENFHNDMISSYKEGLSIDRIDNNGDYLKENCRWADRTIQSNNRRTTQRFEYKGKNLTVIEWSKIVGIKYRTIRKRINILGWSVEKALTTKVYA